MRTIASTRWILVTLVATALSLAVIGSTLPAQGAGAVAISMSLTSQTQLTATSCATDATNLGIVLAGSIGAPTADCTITFGSTNNTSMLHAYQSDGSGSAMYRMTDGTLDANWDNTVVGNGQFTITGATYEDWAYNEPEIALQPTTGKMLASYQRTSAQITIVRFEENGTLDATFGTAGRYTTTLGDISTTSGLAVASDGSIFMTGLRSQTGNREWVIFKLTPNGALDPTFDGPTGSGNGVVRLDVDPAGSELNGMRLLADGDLMLWGYHGIEGIILRTDPNGVPDPAFGGGDGLIDLTIGTHSYIEDATEQPDGKLVFVAWEWSGDTDFVVARTSAAGVLDLTWDGPGTGGGGNGIFWVPGRPGDTFGDGPNGVTVLPDGDILVVGETASNGTDILSMRFNGPTGTLDTTWDGARAAVAMERSSCRCRPAGMPRAMCWSRRPARSSSLATRMPQAWGSNPS